MLRRRRPPAPATPAPAEPPAPHLSAADLLAAGWVLPRASAQLAGGGEPGDRRSTLVGTVSSPTATPIDPDGLVGRDGWSLDWWVGGDDRWHLPSQEPAVRQDLLDDAPVVETRLRVPGGDAIARAYGIRAARGTGDEWVVVEVENATPVPCAVALVVRPLVANGLGSIQSITVEPVAGGKGPEEAQLVRVDGQPALVVPRRPSLVATGNLERGDVVPAVTANTFTVGETGAGPSQAGIEVTCEAGFATLALVFPVPHTAVLRAVLPVGTLDPSEAVAYPSVVPDAATVASGWDIHRGGPRYEIPERRPAVALRRARAQVLLAHDGEAVRRDGRVASDLEVDATVALLGALDHLDRPQDVGMVLARWQQRLAATTPAEDAVFLEAMATHWLLHRDDRLLDWMMPEVSAAVERLGRAVRKGHLTDAADRARTARSLRPVWSLLDVQGQDRAAAAVDDLLARLGDPAVVVDGTAASELLAAASLLGRADGTALEHLDGALADLSGTGTWTGPARRGASLGHDLAAAGALVVALRSLLVSEGRRELLLLPAFPPGWYGGAVELHEAPTAFGRLSYAVRWHGTRPALLWELEPHPDVDGVTLRSPGLDPTWSTTDLEGEALLAEVAPPEGLAPITLVPDHPDIDPDMRRPGEDPGPLPPIDLPEGGTFS